MSEYENPWIYNNKVFNSEDIEDGIAGFIYIITNKLNGKKYIGKKIFTSTRRTKVKNKTRRKITKKESDWKSYYGSSPSLSDDIKHFGKNNFERKIIRLCKSKSELGYFEAKEQFLQGCLEESGFYNEHIMCRVRKANLKFCP